MKRIYALFAALLLAAPAVVAQNNILKLNPLSFALLTTSMSYERYVGQTASVIAGVGYTYRIRTPENMRFQGSFGTVEIRNYPDKLPDMPAGLFYGFFGRYWDYEVRDFSARYGDEHIRMWTVGINLGHQGLFDERTVWEFFLGPSFSWSNLTLENQRHYFPSAYGLGARGGIVIGGMFGPR